MKPYATPLFLQRRRRWICKVKFLIDMPLSPELAVWIVRQGHDPIHALEVGLGRASDAAILERARNEQ